MDESNLSKSDLRKLKRVAKKRAKQEKKKLKAQQQKLDFLIREENRNKICLVHTKNEIEKWIESVAVEDLQNDVFYLAQSLNRSIDKSRFAIETIQNHRRHADEQYNRNFRAYWELIDHIGGEPKFLIFILHRFLKLLQSFSEIFKVFHNSSHRMYEIERESLMKDFFAENVFRESIHYERKFYYENYAHAASTLAKNRINEMKLNFEENKIDIQAENTIQNEILQSKHNRRMTIACRHAKKLIEHFKYERSLETEFEDYNEALTKYEVVESDIRKQTIAIEQAKLKIQKLTDEQQNHEFVNSIKITKLKSEKNFLQKLHHELNERIKIDNDQDQKKIERLVMLGRKAQKSIDCKQQQLDKILSLINMVKKYERSYDCDDEFDGTDSVDQIFPNEKLMRKIGKVQATNVIMRKEKIFLSRRNKEIAMQIINLNKLDKVQATSALQPELTTCPTNSTPVQHVNLIPQIASKLNHRKSWTIFFGDFLSTQ